MDALSGVDVPPEYRSPKGRPEYDLPPPLAATALVIPIAPIDLPPPEVMQQKRATQLAVTLSEGGVSPLVLIAIAAGALIIYAATRK